MSVQFINNLGSGANPTLSHAHEHGGAVHNHDRGGEHGHTHEQLDHPGMPSILIAPRPMRFMAGQASSRNGIFPTTLLEASRSGVSRLGSVGMWL